MGLGFRVSGFGFRVSGFEFRVSGFEFRVSSFESRVSGFGITGKGVPGDVDIEDGSEVEAGGWHLARERRHLILSDIRV